MKLKRWFSVIFALLMGTLMGTSSVAEGFDREKLESAGLNIEEVHVTIPGCTQTYHFIWVSDLHIVIDNEEIADDQHEFVATRQNAWALSSDGRQSGDYWVEEFAEVINSSSCDAIFFGGDMLDLCSEATFEKLKRGMDKITVPYLYIRADHDIGTHWLREPDAEKNQQMHDAFCDNGPVITLEYPEFMILGVNNSTSVMPDPAVDEALRISESGKPIIVVTHVPYNSVVDSSLDEVSRLVWQDRNLSWGEGTSYTPGKKMQEWMDVVCAEETPIVEILAGHLHLTWDGMITNQVHEHVFSQAFSGNIGLITVDGKEEQK